MEKTSGPSEDLLTIGHVARRTACSADTIRYYERIGLMPPAARSSGGHRRYGPEHVRRLIFIRHARDLGFGLEQARDLLRSVEREGYSCAEMDAVLSGRIADIRRKVSELQELERTLTVMLGCCADASQSRCAALEGLFRDDGGQARRGSAVRGSGAST